MTLGDTWSVLFALITVLIFASSYFFSFFPQEVPKCQVFNHCETPERSTVDIFTFYNKGA